MESITVQSRTQIVYRFRCFSWMVILAFLPGCHRADELPRAEVRGKVLYEGQPVKHGMIVFRPTKTQKGPAAGTAIVDGTFLLIAERGPTAGPHEVEVKIVDLPEAGIESNSSARAIRQSTQLKSFTQQIVIKPGINEFEFSFTAAPNSPATSASK